MAEPTTEKKENFAVKYFKDFNVLKEVNKEYWSLQAINVLDCTAYFAMYNVIILILSNDFGFGDTDAGSIFGVFTATTTHLSVFCWRTYRLVRHQESALYSCKWIIVDKACYGDGGLYA